MTANSKSSGASWRHQEKIIGVEQAAGKVGGLDFTS